MNNTEKWWVYKLYCILVQGSHPCISYPMRGYVHITSAELCAWQKIPQVRFRNYLEICQDMDLIEDLKFTKGFVSCKIVLPEAYNVE